MKIFIILGWIILFLLLGSLLYSILFHLKKYFIRKRRIEQGEVGEYYIEGHKKMNQRLIFIQAIKIFVIIFLLFFLVDFTDSDIKIDKNYIEHNWSEKGKQEFLKGCIDSQPIKGLSRFETEEYCKCVLEKTIKDYPDPNKIGDFLPDEFIVNAGKDCLENLNINN